MNGWYRYPQWVHHGIHQETSWECQATQAHPVLWRSARVNDTQPNSGHHYHPTHPLREAFKPNVNQWITCLHLPLIDLALESPQTTNHPSVEKMIGFNLNGSICPLTGMWSGRERERNVEWGEVGGVKNAWSHGKNYATIRYAWTTVNLGEQRLTKTTSPFNFGMWNLSKDKKKTVV